ncbi:hypothetical protein [Mangrovihabitans endophyticus]|uniref:DUF4267 domain-containing protein n=1 Tax=Mangrovihabitans endophyticus TaxID=1751298 RepID=A0A8J3BY17_9ACTN|nr:hypothetical protein [Mangrovihabitans endophyticus]GGK81242.1 hypothetical protein GCM10012284_13990 [Mangrovihabitans endophyticus]
MTAEAERLTAGVAFRAGWGLVLLCAPRRVLACGGHPAPAAPARAVARILGTRHLIQAGLTALAPTRPVVALGAVADVLHAATGVALAVTSPRWRAVAVADTALAAGFAAWGARDHRRLPTVSPWTGRTSSHVRKPGRRRHRGLRRDRPRRRP